MGDDAEKKMGLRERKKVRTRETIRREAFRLFRRDGYDNITIEDIAAAADISPSTFFRYFPAKAWILLSDDHIQPIVDAFAAAPDDLSPVQAYRYAVDNTFFALSEEEYENARIGQELMYAVPEARGLLYQEYARLIAMVTDALDERKIRPSTDVARRTLAGAIVGVLIAASHETPMPHDSILDMLGILETMVPEFTPPE